MWPQSSDDCGPKSSPKGQWLTERCTIRAELAQQALSKCPDTKVVLSGYSQGGQLVHNAAKLLPAKTAEKIAAAVTFGDPGTQMPSLSLSSSHPLVNQAAALLTMRLLKTTANHLPTSRLETARSTVIPWTTSARTASLSRRSTTRMQRSMYQRLQTLCRQSCHRVRRLVL